MSAGELWTLTVFGVAAGAPPAALFFEALVAWRAARDERRIREGGAVEAAEALRPVTAAGWLRALLSGEPQPTTNGSGRWATTRAAASAAELASSRLRRG
jgi:hypothetical protein